MKKNKIKSPNIVDLQCFATLGIQQTYSIMYIKNIYSVLFFTIISYYKKLIEIPCVIQ